MTNTTTERTDAGMKIRNERVQGGHTLATVAALLGLTQQGASHYESTSYTPRVSSLARFYVAANREDLAAPLLSLLNPRQLEEVEQVRLLLRTEGPRLRAAQKRGPNRRANGHRTRLG